MPSVLTPLQLTTAASVLSNTGLRGFPATLQTAITTFNATTVIANFIAAVNFYKAQAFATESTLTSLLSIGSTVCPALGNSIPASPVGTYTYLNNEYLINYLDPVDGSTIDPSGFSNLIEQTCAAYLGNGDYGRFSQGFLAVQGYIASTNQYINSAVNANQFLGPTFTNMDSLTTAGISSTNSDLEKLGVDLAKQGNLVNLQKLDLYGTPAGLVQQISLLAGVSRQAVPALQSVMRAVGLTDTDIENIVTDNRVGLNRPNGLSQNEFDRIQKTAYMALSTVTGDDLAQILSILDVTTPNITNLAQLLNPVKVFPLSYPTWLTPTPTGSVPIFGAGGSVNSSIIPIVNSYLPTASGCDELGKIIPPADAVANKAIEVSLKQINNIITTTLPELAKTILGTVDREWDPEQSYLANDVVKVDSDVAPTFYRAKSPGCTPGDFEVPPGVDITDTDYWAETTLGGLSTMADLPLIQQQTTPVPSSVAQFFATEVATGTGPCGVLTTYDVLGLALDSNDFATRLNTATTAVNALQATITAGSFVVGQTYTITFVGTTNFIAIGASSNTIGVTFTATGTGSGTGTASQLAALNTIYVNMLAAANDAAMITLIGNANTAIAALSASPYVTTLNTAWTYMANLMNVSAKYTTQAGVDYFLLQAGDTNSTKSFVQNLPQYGRLTAEGDAAQFLENLADTATLGGQAIVGTMREGRNQERLNTSGLYNNTQTPSDAVVAPIPVILPVNT